MIGWLAATRLNWAIAGSLLLHASAFVAGALWVTAPVEIAGVAAVQLRLVDGGEAAPSQLAERSEDLAALSEDRARPVAANSTERTTAPTATVPAAFHSPAARGMPTAAPTVSTLGSGLSALNDSTGDGQRSNRHEAGDAGGQRRGTLDGGGDAPLSAGPLVSPVPSAGSGGGAGGGRGSRGGAAAFYPPGQPEYPRACREGTGHRRGQPCEGVSSWRVIVGPAGGAPQRVEMLLGAECPILNGAVKKFLENTRYPATDKTTSYDYTYDMHIK